MELNIALADVRMKLSGVFVRLSVSRDAGPSPCYHRLELERGSHAKLCWKSLSPTVDTKLVWEACISEQAPDEEGGEPEPVIVGGAVTSARGIHRVELRDFYADTNELLGTLEVELTGLPEASAPTATAHPTAVDVLARLDARYESYYKNASAHVRHDHYMRVPTFRFYGAEVQASYLALMRADMDARFARSVLDIVLEDSGMGMKAFIEAGERQLGSGVYLQETAAVVARLGEFVTFTSNILRYRADLSSPALERRELIEKIVPHVREELGGDCEDLALEIYFCFNALRDLSESDDRVVRVAAAFANLYVPFIATTVATSAAAGGRSQGEMLHVFALALTVAEASARMPKRFAVRVPYSWVEDLPNLAPLEGTNWCDALHLPLDRFYGSAERDELGLLDVERREDLGREIAPESRKWPTRIRQEVGASLTDEGFSKFYRRVTELWGDFSDRGTCCFSALRSSTGRFGVGLGEIAGKGDYELKEIFRHDASELEVVRRTMFTVAPVPAWKGEIRRASIAGLRRTARIEPKRISRFHSDVTVYHFRSETLVTSERVRAALRKLEAHFDLDYRAWRLPPSGVQKYIAVYAREKT